VSWYCPRNISNAVRDFSTRKVSYYAKFWDATVRHRCSRSCARCRARFITYSSSEAFSTRNLLPLHIASPANLHIQIGFRRRLDDGSCGIGGIHRQIVIFDILSWWKAPGVPIFLSVSLLLIVVTKLWHDNLSVHVQGSNTPSESARTQSQLWDGQ